MKLTAEVTESQSEQDVEKKHKSNQRPNAYPVPICMSEEPTRLQNLNSQWLSRIWKKLKRKANKLSLNVNNDETRWSL